MFRKLASLLLLLAFTQAAQAQDVHMFWQATPTNPFAAWAPVSSTNPLPVTGNAATGFTPNGNFANLTATNSSADVALPSGAVVGIQNTGTTQVSCNLTVGAGSATTNMIQVPPSSTVFVTVGSNTHGSCIDQSGSTSNVVVFAGGSGLGTGFGGGGGSGGGAVTMAQGAVVSGAFVDGAQTTIGTTADAQWSGSGNGTQIAILKAVYAALGLAIPGGENHIGEVGGNNIYVNAPVVTSAGNIISGQAIATVTPISGATRVSGNYGASGTGGIIQNLTLTLTNAVSATAADVYFFRQQPTSSTCTAGSNFVLVNADRDKTIGIAHVTDFNVNATAAGNVQGNSAIAQALNLAMAYSVSGSTQIWACPVARSTFVISGTSNASLNLDLMRQ